MIIIASKINLKQKCCILLAAAMLFLALFTIAHDFLYEKYPYQIIKDPVGGWIYRAQKCYDSDKPALFLFAYNKGYVTYYEHNGLFFKNPKDSNDGEFINGIPLFTVNRNEIRVNAFWQHSSVQFKTPDYYNIELDKPDITTIILRVNQIKNITGVDGCFYIEDTAVIWYEYESKDERTAAISKQQHRAIISMLEMAELSDGIEGVYYIEAESKQGITDIYINGADILYYLNNFEYK